jgi:hypothetical protein
MVLVVCLPQRGSTSEIRVGDLVQYRVTSSAAAAIPTDAVSFSFSFTNPQ